MKGRKEKEGGGAKTSRRPPHTLASSLSLRRPSRAHLELLDWQSGRFTRAQEVKESAMQKAVPPSRPHFSCSLTFPARRLRSSVQSLHRLFDHRRLPFRMSVRCCRLVCAFCTSSCRCRRCFFGGAR